MGCRFSLFLCLFVHLFDFVFNVFEYLLIPAFPIFDMLTNAFFTFNMFVQIDYLLGNSLGLKISLLFWNLTMYVVLFEGIYDNGFLFVVISADNKFITVQRMLALNFDNVPEKPSDNLNNRYHKYQVKRLPIVLINDIFGKCQHRRNSNG